MTIPNFINDYISKYSSPLDIDISNAGLKDQDTNDLIQLINNNPAIKGINLSQNNMGDESVEMLLKLVNVKYLILSHTDITNIGAIKLIESNRFSSLDLSRNKGINNNTGERILALNYRNKINLVQTRISNDLLEKINVLQNTDASYVRQSIFEEKTPSHDENQAKNHIQQGLPPKNSR
jgi:hypothetical protein